MKVRVSATAAVATVMYFVGNGVLAQQTLQKPTSQFPWKEAYPQPGVVPQPKAEWLQLLNNDTIPKAPVNQAGPGGGLINPNPVGQDPYCSWSFTTCKRPTDIYTCKQGHWGISFDDGPTPASPALYDYLDQTKQKATFFLIGGNVIQYPEMVKRMHEAGHEIAIHTWSHTLLTSQTNEEIVAELKWTEQAIKEVIGVSPRLVRPPFGDMDDRVRNITQQLGFIPAIWDHDTNDWKIGTGGVTSESIKQTVREWTVQNMTTGGISLQHDRVNETVQAAIEVLPILDDAYELTTVGACANMSSNQIYKETMNQSDNTTSAAISSKHMLSFASIILIPSVVLSSFMF